jgi:hypothetical protein
MTQLWLGFCSPLWGGECPISLETHQTLSLKRILGAALK